MQIISKHFFGLLVFMMLLEATSAVHAQTQTDASLRQPVWITIPAGSLADAITELSIQTQVQILVTSHLVKDKKTPSLSGQYSAEAALEKLVEGTGLIVRRSGARALTLVVAQEPMTQWTGPIGLEEVIVQGYVTERTLTGSKMDMPIRELPQSISVVTANQIDVQAAQSLDQALAFTAGVAPVTGGATKTTDEVFSLRGFDDRSSSTIYIDGSKSSRNIFSGTTEPYSLERVEVLKGPASALYGRAAPGGIINLVTKKPTTVPIREIQLQTGTNSRTQLAGDFAGALDSGGIWSYRLTGLYRQADTDIDAIQDDREFFAAAIRWRPGENTSLLMRAEYKKDDTVFNYGLPFEGTVKDNPNGDLDPGLFIGEPDFDRWETTNTALSYQFEHVFNETFTVRQNFHQFVAEVDYAYIFFDIFVPGVGVLTWTDASLSTKHRGYVQRTDDDEGYSLDTHLQINLGTDAIANTLLIGVDTIDGEFDRDQSRGLVGSNPLDDSNTLNLYNPVYQPTITVPALRFRTLEGNGIEQTGIYLQNHLKINGNWAISAGIRRDEVSLDSDYTEPDTPYSESFTEDSDATTFNAGIVYLADNGLSPYVSYSESFQPNVGLDSSGNLLDPAEGSQIEVGIKYRPQGAKMQMSMAVFDIENKNIAVNSFAGYEVNAQIDVGSKGFEFETHAHVTDNLNLIAAYTYIDAKVTRSTLSDEGFIRFQKGNRTAGQPEHAASIWLDYTLPLLPELTVGGGVRYVGETVDFTNEVEVPSYTVADLVAQYSAEQWTFALNVKNLADKTYISACTYACWYGDGRSALLTATYSW